jgi:hypothetical protein
MLISRKSPLVPLKRRILLDMTFTEPYFHINRIRGNSLMSYYNFNDHFWSPKKVCCQSTQDKSKPNRAKKKIILTIFSLGCIAISTPLLLPELVSSGNENQGEAWLNKNLGNRCVVLGREPLQIHCSVQK